MRTKYSEQDLIEAVKTSSSIADVCRKVGLKPAGGNYKTIKQKIIKFNIDDSHFLGQGWNVGLKFNPKPAKDIEQYLVENSTYQSSKLAKRLLKEGYKEHKCEVCELTEWLGKLIPLELHHINGISSDHRIDNLQLLCPNCHAQTDNYRGKNIGMSAQEEILEVEPCKFEEPLLGNANGNLEPSLNEEGVETRHKEPKSKDMVKE